MSQQEALQCVQEMNSTELLFVFVRNGLESTLERSTIAREHMGMLLHQLIKTGTLPTLQYYKGSVWSPREVVQQENRYSSTYSLCKTFPSFEENMSSCEREYISKSNCSWTKLLCEVFYSNLS